MNKPIRVLIVEDVEDDAALVVQALRRGGYDPSFERVQTAAALREALVRQTWDIILSDYAMPQFNGIEALEVLKATGLDIPFILISGTVGEDIAVAAMKAGASDYFLKGNLARLPAAIERELREVEVHRGRRRSDESLRRSEVRFQLYFQNMPIGCIVWDRDFRIVSWNPAAEKTFGFKAEEALGKHPYDLIVPPAAQPHVEGIYRRLLEGDPSVPSENENVTRDGRVITCRWSYTPFFDDDGKVLGVISMAEDITKRKRAEEALRLSEARLKEAQRIAHLGDWEHDLTTNHIVWSDELFRIFGFEPGAVQPSLKVLEEVLHPDDRTRVLEDTEQLLQGSGTSGIEYRIQRPNKEVRWLQTHKEVQRAPDGKPVRIVGTVHDITDKNLLEQQFIQAQKMEAVGRLAGGIAHDFNNLLTIINGYSQLLLERVESQGPIHDQVGLILKAGERATALTRQLLAFSRKQIVVPQVADLNAIVSDIDKMLRRLIGEDIEFLTVLRPHLKKVKVDKGQIEQVLTNLVVNARDAMPQGGRITIETADVELDASYVSTHTGVTPGRYVMLAVSDTGHGMDAETQAHIFEPFFTTKEAGKGTGLGLATVYGIVKQSGGHIWIYSEPGRGTTFKIYLPRATEAGEAVKAEKPAKRLARGRETILLVEDEPGLRGLAQTVLESAGYRVLVAFHPQEAVGVCEGEAGTIHLLLTDVVMPGMSGRVLADHFAFSKPGMKVLYMSGYTDNAVVHHGVLEEGTNFLQKPFSPDVLLRKVRDVLEKG